MARKISYRRHQRGAGPGNAPRPERLHHGRRQCRRRRRARRGRRLGRRAGGHQEPLYHQFPGRVLDTPLSEIGYVGAAVGAATRGMRPVCELMFVDFAGCCPGPDPQPGRQFRYMFGGKAVTPLVIRTMVGAGLRAAAQHSQMLTSLWTHIPGLKVVCPSSPYDAKGLLVQAIRDNDPVIFCEHKLLYSMQGEVPEELYSVPFGEANFLPRRRRRHPGDLRPHGPPGAGRRRQPGAPGHLLREVLDLRSTSPLDEDSILESVEKTGRLVVVDETNTLLDGHRHRRAGRRTGLLRAARADPLTAPHTPVPFSDALEDLYIGEDRGSRAPGPGREGRSMEAGSIH